MTHPVAFKPLSKINVAEILGVSVRTIENHIAAGLLPAPASIGNRRYWHPDVFYTWLGKRLLGEGQDASISEVKDPAATDTPQSGPAESGIPSGVIQARRPAQPRVNGSMVERARARDSAALRKLEGL